MLPRLNARLLRILLILAAFLFLMGLIALLAYWLSFTVVTFEIEGQSQTVRVRAKTVGEALEAAKVVIDPADILDPNRETPLTLTHTIRIDKAEQVALEIEGQSQRLYTHHTDPVLILREAEIQWRAEDIVLVDGIPILQRQPSDQAPRTIRIIPAVTVTVEDNGVPGTLNTTTTSVGAALRDNGTTLYLADRVEPDLSTPLIESMTITIERSKPIHVTVDGRELATRSRGESVGEALAVLGIILTGQDYVIPDESSLFTYGLRVRIVRVTDEIQATDEPLPYRTIFQADPNLPLDEQRVIQNGVNGIQQARLRIRYEDGREVSRVLLDRLVTQPAVDAIIAYGTQVTTQSLATPIGTLQYWRVIPMQVSAYSPTQSGVNPTDPNYGKTLIGTPIRQGIVAADPSLLPLGTQVYIEGYGQAVVEDTLNSGLQIKLGYDDGSFRLWNGQVNVFVLAPVPTEILYILPGDSP